MLPTPVAQALQAATAQYRVGLFAAAEAECRRILAQYPPHPDVMTLLGGILATVQQYDEAIEWLTKAAALRPDQSRYHCDLGVIYRRAGRIDEAVACLERAAALEPNSPLVRLNLGDALHAAGRLEEAISHWQFVLTVVPDCAEAHNNLGNAFTERGKWAEAIARYRQALALRPDYVEAINNLSAAFLGADQLEEALAYCRRTLAMRPNFAEGYANLGAALVRQGFFEEALTAYRQALALHPDFAPARWNLALLLLLFGQYEEGWREHEWRWASPDLSKVRRSFSQPQWEGRPAPGETILVHTEQGHGDTLNFIRYLTLMRAKAQAAEVILECPFELVRLLQQSGGWNATIVPKRSSNAAQLPSFDRHIPLLSLPLALGINKPLPMEQPYLQAAPPESAAWRERLSSTAGLRVGLCWAGSSIHRDDKRRSLPASKLLPLLDRPGVSFYSLQLNPDAQQIAPLLDAGLTDLTSFIGDFADTAALLSELDLVISVDTAVVHLAGALGRPVWTLLSTVPDWRWGLLREETAWYPSMRLFRQRQTGDWDEVIQRVAGELAIFSSQRASGR